jgi:hypothetical protein
MCDLCHDTGFRLRGDDASYCECDLGQRLKQAREQRHVKLAGKVKPRRKKEWLPYREPGDEEEQDVPF